LGNNHISTLLSWVLSN